MKKALAVISYARERYFELVVPSILDQKIFGKSVSEVYDIYLFQDGLWEAELAHTVAGYQAVSRAIQSLSSQYPVYQQDQNLGVALHFDFIERLLFDQKGYDFVAFFEDDLVLAPGYMQALDLMAQKFDGDARVGMVSAHPSNPTIPLATQRGSLNQFAPIGHNWGFGLSRSFWLRRQPFVDCYLDLIHNVPYRKRPHKVIWKWLETVGFPAAASSQDYVKQCATYALGACRLSTKANLGLPIGRSGLHCKPELFKKMGFDRTIVCDEPINELADLAEGQFQSLYSKQSQKFGEEFFQNGTIDRAAWEKNLLSGEFHPSRIMASLGISGDFAPKYFRMPLPMTNPEFNPSIPKPTAPSAIQSTQENQTMEKLVLENCNPVMEKLYGENIWNGFTAPLGVQEVQGWNGNHPVFGKLIQELKPEVVFDVGVWKGLSSITLARSMKEAGVNGCVVSVDTFLGSPEHWSHTRNLFKRKHGFPDLYDQFMSNVYHAGMQDIIIPMPQLSHVAAHLLHKMGIRAKLIHIDAAHEYEEVLRDAIAYWEVLEEGGVMVGDDYHPTWPGVVKAADEFAKKVGRSLQVESPKWILRK